MREDDKQLEQMMSLKHRNVATFFGLWHDTRNVFGSKLILLLSKMICLLVKALFTQENSTDSGVDNDWYFLQEYGVRGSLQDILGRVQITWQVKKSFMRDISCGMQYM